MNVLRKYKISYCGLKTYDKQNDNWKTEKEKSSDD